MVVALFIWFTGYYEARHPATADMAGFGQMVMTTTYSILIGCV